MHVQQTLLSLVLSAGGLIGFTNAQAQNTVVVDIALGTQVGTSNTDPGQPDNVSLPILGGELLSVASNGTRTVLSDFGDATQGPIGSGYLGGVTSMPSGSLSLTGQVVLVTDAEAGTNNAGALFTVDSSSGERSILSDFGDPVQGPTGVQPIAVVYDNGLLGLDNAIYVLDNEAGTNNVGALFKVDPANGNRTLISDFGNDDQGVVGVNPISITLAQAGLLTDLGITDPGFLVLDDDAGTNGVGAVFFVDASNGERTLISDLGDANGTVAASPKQIATATSDLLGTAIYVTDNEAGSNNLGAIFLIDQSNGSHTIISDFGNDAQGLLGDDPKGIAAAADGSGNVLVTDDLGSQIPTVAQLFLVTPSTGDRTSYSNCTDANLGPCQTPNAVAQW
jgi:hypothetical protein